MKSNENNSKYHLTFKNFTDLSLSDSLNKTKDYEEIEEDFKEEIEETKDKFEPKEIQ